MLAIEILVEEILRLQNTVMYLQAQLQEARKMQEQGFELQYETPKGFATPHFRRTDVEKLVEQLDWLRRRHIEATVVDMQTREEVGGVTPGDAINPWNYWLWSKPENAQELISRMCANPLVVLMEDEIIHTDEHPECDDPDCICHWERATQNEADIYGTHAPDCRCGWCEPEV